MTRSQRLHPVVQHTDKKEQRALQEVAVSQNLLEIEQARQVQLQNYKLEYLEKKKYDIGVFTPHELQEFNRFLQQLDQTIERQMEVVELRQQELLQKRRLWNAMRIDSKKMHKVVDKLQQQEFVEQERKEQKALDEFAQRKFNRR
ncbi:MAG: flagellar export protein FliJ [Gammaproteobacteria bacterium]|nr:flagellar export protein FliJ [Gammaproteobacteria bacterium]